MDLKLIAENIKKTGFVLEHQVTEILKAHKWIVINNRYYLDDVQEIAREIDLVGYKVHIDKDFLIYTALIISCKKSEENLWSLLFRAVNKDDLNVEWHPIKFWSNNKVLKYLISLNEWRESYINVVEANKLYSELMEPSGHLFAFQEIKKSNLAVQNDKNIFNSISSLMKAESYEMGILSKRIKKPAIYNFQLISVLDTELIRIDFDKDQVDAKEIDQATCIFSYIINKQSTSSRIHFCTFKNFSSELDKYDRLHETNIGFSLYKLEQFYKNVLSNETLRNVLRKDFEEEALHVINLALAINGDEPLRSMGFSLNEKSNTLEIATFADEEVNSFLNQSNLLKFRMPIILEKIFKYSGEFTFVRYGPDDIPF